MEKVLKETLKRILSIYNYKIEDQDISIRFSQDISIRFSQEKMKDKISVVCNKSNEELQTKLYGRFYINNEPNYNEISFSICLNRDISCFKHIEFITKNCLYMLNLNYFAYKIKAVNTSVLYALIDKTIEESVIAIMVGNVQNNYMSDLLVDKMSIFLQKLEEWANRTYEGRKIPFSFLINIQSMRLSYDTIDNITLFLKDDASALITDGITSYLKLAESIEYKLVDVIDVERINKTKKIPFVPYRFSSFGSLCMGDNIGVVLTIQGDVLFIKKKKLLFAKRNGQWHYYDYAAFNISLFNDIMGKENKKVRESKIKSIYLTCLDVAFSRTGGCLAICDEDKIVKIKRNINESDVFKPFTRKQYEDPHRKKFILENVIVNKNTFFDIKRKARQELLGIDGATIITSNGKIITAGSIIDNKNSKKNTNNQKVEDGGARKKITQKLSEYGVAIKVSADGYIECYKNKIHIF